MLFVS